MRPQWLRTSCPRLLHSVLMRRHREIARFDQILDTTPIACYIADEKRPVTGSPATGLERKTVCYLLESW